MSDRDCSVTLAQVQTLPVTPSTDDEPASRGCRSLTPGHLVADFAAAGAGGALADACQGALGSGGAEAGGPEAGSRRLLALQTSYAIVVKLVAARVLAALKPGDEATRFEVLATASEDALRGFMAALEDGQAARAAGFENLLGGDAFGWYVAPGCWTPALAEAVRGAIARLADYDGHGPMRGVGAPCDLFRPLYQQMIPAALRHDLGEYYTPRWLAQAVLADLPGTPGWRGLDPCCGSGTFLVELLAEVLAETDGLPADEQLRQALTRVCGNDVNPLAVLTARVNFFVGIAGLVAKAGEGACPVAIPVYLGDAAAATPEGGPGGGPPGLFDRVVGNPPWVMWKDLPDGYREPIRDLCRARGLFSDDAWVGGTDLNVCALIAHVALERWVAPGGRLAFLMPHQLLQVRSCQGLRRWRLPDGTPIGLEALTDWSALRPFEAACRPVTYLLSRGRRGPAAVPVRIWHARAGAGPRDPGAAWRQVVPTLVLSREAAHAVDEAGGPYLVDAPEVLPRLLALLGESAYRGRRATETSPHGVYWVRPVAGEAACGERLLVENGLNPRARDGVSRRRAWLEPACLYPLLRGADVQPFRAEPGETLVVLPHDVETGAKPLPPERLPPATLAYLAGYRGLLERRGSYREYRAGQPFYGLWRVGPYTFAPWKVVWPELGELRAAVVGTAVTAWGERKLVIPEGKVNLVPCADAAEAHFLCALLNAPDVRRAYARMSSQIGRPSRLPFAIPRYDAGRWTHRALAAVSGAAHAGRLKGDRRDALLSRLLGRTMGRGRLPIFNQSSDPPRHPPTAY